MPINNQLLLMAARGAKPRIKKSFLNTDMGPTQFRAALTEFQSELKRVYSLKTQLLAAGIHRHSARVLHWH